MTPPRTNAKQVFLDAIEQYAPDQWPNYLDQVCDKDAELRRRVEVLLGAHVADGSLLDNPAMAPAATIEHFVAEMPGTQIGPYKLLEQIGEGGMGVVFVAEQTAPVRRKVALKIIKPGMDTRQVIARFEAERQALAMMDHPNIAKVLDAGTTGGSRDKGQGTRASSSDPPTLDPRLSTLDPSSGRPYFVMDLVKGIPITEYCDRQQLTVRERLELFTQVCHAVQHAHQKGIIHRDLKPSNVLVAEYDGTPVPKIIDFGVAKATAQRLTERTMFTQYGQLVGTFQYMSPEQARFNQLDVDTRSDIYSLGVLLYELLAGSTPLEKDRLRSAAFDEILRLIGEEEPPTPSTRLSSLPLDGRRGAAAPRVGEGDSCNSATIAANRQSEPAKLTKELSCELDWIVMKCLEKDRARRYETANSLGQDIERYLHDEPVQACPPSAAYRFRKFARRNSAALAIAITLALAALVAVGTIGWAARDRFARYARLSSAVENALADANRARDWAHSRMDDRFDWQASLAAASAALQGGEMIAAHERVAINPSLMDRMDRLRANLQADEMDRHFVARLDEILTGVIVWDARRSQSKREQSLNELMHAFKQFYGWNAATTAVSDLAFFIKSRPIAVQRHLLVALDVALALSPRDKPEVRRWLADAIDTADSNPWRKQVRLALANSDWQTLEGLLQNTVVSHQSPALLAVLSSYLPHSAIDTKTTLCRKIQTAYPDQRWAPGRFTSALSQHFLAWHIAILSDAIRENEPWALELAQASVRLVPNDGDFWSVLGMCYYRVGKWEEASAALQNAMELSAGGNAEDWFFVAMAQWQLGDKEESVIWYDKAVEWMDKYQPQNAELTLFRDEATDLLHEANE